MRIHENVELASMTSFGVGGPAEKLITLEHSSEAGEAIVEAKKLSKIWQLGYGTNVLISDNGLPGSTLLLRNKQIDEEDNLIIADAGVWWDDLVQYSIDKKLWGLELMSGIPGSVGAGIFINITAYGQSLADQLVWVEAYNPNSNRLVKLEAKNLAWSYKQSIFQNDYKNWLIIRAAFALKPRQTHELTYQSALDIAVEFKIDPNTLKNRRRVIMEARHRAGSLFSFEANDDKTVGSFFRNPVVTTEQAEHVMTYDESGKTKEQITNMNTVHGGDSLRVSAAHVMLAAGFKRGQAWGPVRLHPKNLLKIENTGGATAQQIYDVAQNIIKTVKDKLNITLESEAQILGEF